MTEPVWLLILAAGQSKRMGTRKQLLPIHGESMLRYVARKVLSAAGEGEGVQAAVIGTNDPMLKRECADLPIAWVENLQAEQGISSSIRAGIQHALANGAGAVMILLGDQPDIDPKVISRMLEAYRDTRPLILQARYEGQPGHPVLFDKALFAQLLQLEGDVGARLLLREHRASVQFMEASSVMPGDIDTMQDYESYLLADHSELSH